MAEGGDSGKLAVKRLGALRPDELERLAHLGRESLGEAALDEWQLPVIASFGALFVAELEGEIVGSAQLIRCLDDGDIYLDVVFIRPGLRGRGLGSALLAGVMRRLPEAGFSRLLVTVDPENQAAMALYEAQGFATVRTLEDFYGAGRRRVLLAATLTTG